MASQQELVDILARTAGPDATATFELSRLMDRAVRHPEALALRERVLAARKRTLGPDHPETLEARLQVANSLGDVGRTGDRERALRAVLEGHRRRGPEGAVEVARCLCLLGYELDEQRERAAEAAAVWREAAAIRERELGFDAGRTRSAALSHAASLAKLGRRAEAVAVARRVAEACEAACGPSDPETASARDLLERLSRERTPRRRPQRHPSQAHGPPWGR